MRLGLMIVSVLVLGAFVCAFSLWQDDLADAAGAALRSAPEPGAMHEPQAPQAKKPIIRGAGPQLDARVDQKASLTRQAFLKGAAALAAGGLVPYRNPAVAADDPEAGKKMLTRTIPSSRKALPVIGLGTWQVFDVGSNIAERAPLSQVLKTLFAAGGSVVDSSPMYGRAEDVAGDLIEAARSRDKAFIATKVWTRGKGEGIAQMERSFSLLRTDKIDLMQVHNLVDYKVHLDTLRGWKKDGRVGYIGVTHYTASAFGELEAVLRSEKLDFVQLNYSADDRAAEKVLLPLAEERGIAVLINRPFGGGGLMRALKDKPLPDFAGEIGATSWAQLLLKFIIAHPAVTCAIPGTAKPEHMADNVQGGMGAMPDTALRERIAKAVRS